MVGFERKKEFCIDKEINSGDSIILSYMISGQEEDKTHTRIKGPHSTDYYDNKIIESQSFKSSEEIKIKIEFSGVYSLCFISKSNSDIVTSFEYFTANESGHLINIAKNGVFEEIYKNLTTLSYLFEEIERNLRKEYVINYCKN